MAGRSGFPVDPLESGSLDTLDSGAEKTDGAVWDTEAEERRVESERERSLNENPDAGGIAQQTGSTWDRLRQQSTPRQSTQPTTQSAYSQRQPIDISTLPNQRPANPLEMSTTTQSKYAPGLSVEEKIEQETAEERRREQEEFERYVSVHGVRSEQ